MKTKALYRSLLIVAIVIFCMAYHEKTPRERDSDLILKNHEGIHKALETDPDKTLLIGEWSKTGTPYLIKITGLQEIGSLEVQYYNPKKIEIEMANWRKLGTLLSVYIELQNTEYPGSNFKLNYIPERDVLVGEYFDAMDGMMYSVEFVRIK